MRSTAPPTAGGIAKVHACQRLHRPRTTVAKNGLTLNTQRIKLQRRNPSSSPSVLSACEEGIVAGISTAGCISLILEKNTQLYGRLLNA